MGSARLASLFALAALPLSAAPAHANVPVTAKVALPVVVDATGVASGTATLTAQYSDTSATVSAAGTGVVVAVGGQYHVDTCVKAHLMSKSFSTTCNEKSVDTRVATAAVKVAAPTVTTTAARPAAGKSGYASFIVSVSKLNSNGAYAETATSWPTAGLSQASIPLPAQGDASAPAPASEGVMRSGGKSGGINSGEIDSFCMGSPKPLSSAPGPGVSTNALGSGAPAYYEVGEPTGAYLGQPPKGVMFVIHGGGWYQTGAGRVADQRADADRWRARGWRTLNIDYRPCGQSLADSLWFYDRAQATWGSGLKYCAWGASAGGNLALLIAANRPSLACAISASGPTDATTLPDQPTANPSPTAASDGPKWTYNYLVAAVGGAVYYWSPALFAINARVLWAGAANDWIVPNAQGTELQGSMLAADPAAYVDVKTLDAGTVPWVHSNVSQASLDAFYAAEDQLVAPLAG